MRTPDLLLVGPGRTGTTTLFSLLSASADVCTCGRKEVDRYRNIIFSRPLGDLRDYAGLFAHCGGEKHVMEATPGYFFGGAPVARAIHEELGPVRVLVSLREPASRLYSLYKHFITKLDTGLAIDFEAYVDRCRRFPEIGVIDERSIAYAGLHEGHYAAILEAWYAEFGEAHVKVVFFEDLQANQRSVVRDLCGWLCLPEIEFGSEVATNQSAGYRSGYLQRIAQQANLQFEGFFRSNPTLKQVLKNAYMKLNAVPIKAGPEEEGQLRDLRSYYEPHNKALFDLLQRVGVTDVPSWVRGY